MACATNMRVFFAPAKSFPIRSLISAVLCFFLLVSRLTCGIASRKALRDPIFRIISGSPSTRLGETVDGCLTAFRFDQPGTTHPLPGGRQRQYGYSFMKQEAEISKRFVLAKLWVLGREGGGGGSANHSCRWASNIEIYLGTQIPSLSLLLRELCDFKSTDICLTLCPSFWRRVVAHPQLWAPREGCLVHLSRTWDTTLMGSTSFLRFLQTTVLVYSMSQQS
jgi:hypothetical protein